MIINIIRTRLIHSIKMSLPKVIFVLGGPGAGKGTQCEFIVKKYGYEHLSAGDLLRAERQTPGSPYGELIETLIKEGKIVPVEITCGLIEKAMDASGKNKFLIDGFPRNEDNLQGWNKQMAGKVNLKFVLFFECSEKACTERCLARGAAGSGRVDDNLESLCKRFNTYINDTMPIIQHYEKLGLVKRVDASASKEEVSEAVKKIFDNENAEGDN